MTKTDTKKRLRIYIIAAVILVIIAGAAAFVWYRYGSVKVSCMLDDGSVTETRLSRGDSFVFPETADYDGYTFVYWMDAKGARYRVIRKHKLLTGVYRRSRDRRA